MSLTEATFSGAAACTSQIVSCCEKIDNQTGAVLAQELKMRRCYKIDPVQIGQVDCSIDVGRCWENVYDHAVLSMQTYQPMNFAAQITLNEGTMWGIMSE